MPNDESLGDGMDKFGTTTTFGAQKGNVIQTTALVCLTVAIPIDLLLMFASAHGTFVFGLRGCEWDGSGVFGTALTYLIWLPGASLLATSILYYFKAYWIATVVALAPIPVLMTIALYWPPPEVCRFL